MAGSRLIAALLGLSLVAITPPLMAEDADPAREAFKQMDLNGDGVISREEFELTKVNVIFRRSVARGAQLRFEDTRLSREAFDAIDLDGDGLITASDVREAPFFKFDSYDRNGDNVIDFNEFRDLLTKLGIVGPDSKAGR